jgi:hypothetical protein
MPEFSAHFQKLLAENACTMHFIVQQFSGAQLLSEQAFPLNPNLLAGSTLESGPENEWRIDCSAFVPQDRPEALELRFHLTLQAEQVRQTSLGIAFSFGDWTPENYLLMPAAVYNGNRFESRRMTYPPILEDPADIGADVATIITDVPRLNIHPGPSRIQQLTRDLATPAVGFFAPASQSAFWLLTDQATCLGDSGLTFEENQDRTTARLLLSAPGVRQNLRYTIGDTQKPSEDRGADLSKGDAIELRLRLYFFSTITLQGLFDHFVEIRKDLSGEPALRHCLPFSSAWDIQEAKYNQWNWNERYGYYAVGSQGESPYEHWQTGWVGGLMSTYPLLSQGSPLSRQRACRTFDFVLPGGLDPSGLIQGNFKDGVWFGDNFRAPSKKWLLIRKSADALYFIIKQFMLLQKQDPNWQIPQAWADSAIRCAQGFVGLWERYGQFGQFVDTQTGEIIVGGSASASTAPAALALAWQFFGDESFLRAARESASHFYRKFVQKGYTTGGPGEILQCPDSESAFGLLESFVVLSEVTGEPGWLKMAIEQANQCFTWCVSYDFKFPPASTFGQLDMRTCGSVYANVQNKHSAPGICTLSGDSLFKLFRATGNPHYLRLIQEIAHNLPQYLSRQDRPISAMPAGWMNERVEMSDWLEPIGEIFYGSCWCEVSNMLTYTELPGLYVQPDNGLVCAFDHLDVVILADSAEKLVLELTNPTAFPARVRLLVEDSAAAAVPLGQNGLLNCSQLSIGAGETITIELPKINAGIQK